MCVKINSRQIIKQPTSIKFIKSDERSEDSYIGLGDFYFFFRKKSKKSLVTTDVHSYILMHL